MNWYLNFSFLLLEPYIINDTLDLKAHNCPQVHYYFNRCQSQSFPGSQDFNSSASKVIKLADLNTGSFLSRSWSVSWAASSAERCMETWPTGLSSSVGVYTRVCVCVSVCNVPCVCAYFETDIWTDSLSGPISCSQVASHSSTPQWVLRELERG